MAGSDIFYANTVKLFDDLICLVGAGVAQMEATQHQINIFLELLFRLQYDLSDAWMGTARNHN